jgi:predicted  nucleic acid-binding Zn-ribbon protein
LAATEKEFHSQHAAMKDAELESQALAERIAAGNRKLMDGSVRIPKELDALEHSVASLRRQRESVEEAAMQALLETERLSALQKDQARQIEEAVKKWSVRHAELEAEENKLKRYALQLKAQRAKIVESLPAADMALYDDMRKRKAGIAVASVENGQCSACNVRVPTGVISATRTHSEPVYCTSCGRILVSK